MSTTEKAKQNLGIKGRPLLIDLFEQLHGQGFVNERGQIGESEQRARDRRSLVALDLRGYTPRFRERQEVTSFLKKLGCRSEFRENGACRLVVAFNGAPL